MPPTELVPSIKEARVEATVRHQRDLEDELKRRLPSLYRKALDLEPDDNWIIKAPIVEHLSRGLEKMQRGGRGVANTNTSGYPDKLQREKYTSEVRDPAESDDESYTRDKEQPKSGGKAPPEDMSGSGADRKGRGRNMWKNMLRSGR